MKLWIDNIAPGTSDEELKALIKKYSPELTCENIMRVDDSDSRPAALIKVTGGPFGSPENLCLRISGIYWKQRRLLCHTIGVFDR